MEENTPPVAASYKRGRKAEVERVSRTAHTVTSEDDSEMAYSLGKCHHVKSMFQPHVSFLE